MVMERKSYKAAGYDCRNGVCPHTPKCRAGYGGIDGGRYYYTVREGDLVAVVYAFARDFPLTVPKHVRNRRDTRLVGGVSIHAPFPTDREDILKKSKGSPCEFLDGKPCWVVWDSSLALEERFGALIARDDFGGPLYEQPEPFWAALEAFLTKMAPAILDNRADTKWEVCPCCKGEATVRKGTPWRDVVVP